MGPITAASMLRHRGLSIGELVDRYVGKRSKTLFLSAFLELTAQTFSADAVVAFSAIVYSVWRWILVIYILEIIGLVLGVKSFNVNLLGR